MSATIVTPPVSWAQRSDETEAAKNVIYLKVHIFDAKNCKIDLTEEHLEINSDSGEYPEHYNVKIDFFDSIDVKESKYDATSNGRYIVFILRKKKLSEHYWPRLTKEKAKYRWLKTDFDKWVDEDEQEGVEEDDAQAEQMRSMMQANAAGGMPGMPGMGGMPGMEGLGGMGGMPGMEGMGGMPGMEQMFGGAGGGAPGGMDFQKMMEQMAAANKQSPDEESSSDDEEEAKEEKEEAVRPPEIGNVD